jgi:signal transduction histidine kinase
MRTPALGRQLAEILAERPTAAHIVEEYRRRAFPKAFMAILVLAIASSALTIGRRWPELSPDPRGWVGIVFWCAVAILLINRRWSERYYPWILAPVSILALINIFRTGDAFPGPPLDSYHLRLFATFVFVTVLFRLPWRIAAAISGLSFLYVAWDFTRWGSPNGYAALFSIGGVIFLCVATLRGLEAREREVIEERFERQNDLRKLEQVNARYEDAHRAATTQLEQQSKEAAEAIASKTQFIKKATHDLRNSVGGIENFLETLQSSLSKQQTSLAMEQLSSITYGVQILSKRIHQILAFTNFDAPGAAPKIEAIDVRQLLNDVRRELEPRALAKKIDLRIYTSGAKPLVVDSNPMMLWQILSNLVSNAIKFTYPSNPSKRVQGVLIGAVRIADRVQINVWDTGIGIPPTYLDRIWKPHERVPPSAGKKEEGDGLGLAIVEAAVRQLPSHEVFVSSRVDRGSHFRLEMPASAAENVAREPWDAAGELTEPRMCPPRVILLEDDDFVRRSEEQLLGEWGATLIASGASVEEVLAAASASAMCPDAIVSDSTWGQRRERRPSSVFATNIRRAYPRW